MHLGELISQFDDESVVLETLARLDDLALLARVRRAADAPDTDICGFVQEAVGRFATGADEAEWLGLIAIATKSSDPGLAALKRMLESALGRAETSG